MSKKGVGQCVDCFVVHVGVDMIYVFICATY